MDLHLKVKRFSYPDLLKELVLRQRRLFLEEGATVIINGRTKNSVESALSSLNNDNVSGIVGDFIDESQVINLIDQIPNDIDILVNNVGILEVKNLKMKQLKIGTIILK